MLIQGGPFVLLVFVLGILANLASLAGLAFSLWKKTRKITLTFSIASLASAAVLLGLTWISYRHSLSLVQNALPSVPMEEHLRFTLMGHVEAARAVSLGLWMATLPLLLGVLLLLRGYSLDRREAAPGKLVPRFAAAALFLAGTGLGVAALFDYLRYEDFFMILLLWF
jgi:phosphoglycerol transferase MdoB-like AlkP superfamily enzyme